MGVTGPGVCMSGDSVGMCIRWGLHQIKERMDKKSQIWTFRMAFFIPNAKHWGQKCGA